MIRFDKALDTVLAAARPLASTEETTLDACVGRVLARAVSADRPLPPYDRVAVDGYACRRSDLSEPLKVIGAVAAGAPPQRDIEPGTAIRVMTGGVLPAGADTVVMVEHTVEEESGTVRVTQHNSHDNIARTGEDAAQGEVLIPAGVRLAERHIATLAAVGAVRPMVWKRPRVALISSGDEVIPPDEKPLPHQIRNSNGPMLAALCRRAGGEVSFTALVPDRLDDIASTIAIAIAKSDVVLVSGGVSKGDFDLVPASVHRLGGRILFDGVAIKPGKPTTAALINETLLLCLPGNPVSVFVTFELFARPVIDKAGGVTQPPIEHLFPLGNCYERRSADRDEWIPSLLRGGKAYPLRYHGSGHFVSLVNADCLVRIPAGVTAIASGESVHARLV